MIILISWWLAIVWTFSDLFPRPFDDWKNTLLYVGAGCFVIAQLVKRRARKHALTPALSSRESGFLGLYFAIALLSIFFAPTARYEGLLELARLVLWLGLAWVFAQAPARTWLWFFRLTVISAAIIAILTWFQSRGTNPWPYSGIFLPPIGHITYYGDFMALSLIMAMGLLFQNEAVLSLLWILCMALIDMGLALSATRASLLGVIAALFLALPLVGMMTRSLKTIGVIALIGILNLAVIFSLPVTSLRGASAGARLQQATSLSQATIDAASSGRWHTYVTSAHIAMERPIVGWGLGTFRFVYPEYAHRNTADSLVSSAVWYMHPHNEVLHQAVELGPIGTFLFILGFLYLLYRGIQALCRGDKKNQAILITTMGGLVAAFISWQLSTNFLFPVSRLMTALFAGIILHLCQRERSTAIQSAHTGLLRGLRPLTMTAVVLSTLLLTAYQTSLMCVQKEQTSRNARTQWDYATWAVRLAPGAFDPLFIRAAVALNTQRPAEAEPYVISLYESYPYVPAVLHMMGILRAKEGQFQDARNLLSHALANDPNNAAAKQLLDQLPPDH